MANCSVCGKKTKDHCEKCDIELCLKCDCPNDPKVEEEPPKPVKFSMLRADLAYELAQLAKVVEKKGTIPILGCVAFFATKNLIKLVGTDLDHTVVCELSTARVDLEGALILPYARLNDVIASLDEGEVTIEQTVEQAKAKEARLSSGSFSMLFKELNKPDQFPDTVQFENFPFWIKVGELVGMIDKTDFGITKDDTRYNLAVARLMRSGNALRMVTTDGLRVVMAETKEHNTPLNFSVLLQKPALAVIEHIFKAKEMRNEFIGMGIRPRETEGEIAAVATEGKLKDNSPAMLHGEDFIGLRYKNRKIFIRTRSGGFPLHERIIPQDRPVKMTVSVDALLKVLKRIEKSLKGTKSGMTVLRFEEKLKLSASADYEAEVSETLGYKKGESASDFVGAIDRRLILEFLEKIKGDDVVMEINSNQLPYVFHPQEDPRYQFILLPITVDVQRLVEEAVYYQWLATAWESDQAAVEIFQDYTDDPIGKTISSRTSNGWNAGYWELKRYLEFKGLLPAAVFPMNAAEKAALLENAKPEAPEPANTAEIAPESAETDPGPPENLESEDPLPEVTPAPQQAAVEVAESAPELENSAEPSGFQKLAAEMANPAISPLGEFVAAREILEQYGSLEYAREIFSKSLPGSEIGDTNLGYTVTTEMLGEAIAYAETVLGTENQVIRERDPLLALWLEFDGEEDEMLGEIFNGWGYESQLTEAQRLIDNAAISDEETLYYTANGTEMTIPMLIEAIAREKARRDRENSNCFNCGLPKESCLAIKGTDRHEYLPG